MRTLLSLLVVLLAVGPTALMPAPSASAEPVVRTLAGATLHRGFVNESMVQYLVFTNATAWSAFHHAQVGAPVPKVDFNTSMVLAAVNQNPYGSCNFRIASAQTTGTEEHLTVVRVVGATPEVKVCAEYYSAHFVQTERLRGWVSFHDDATLLPVGRVHVE